MANLRYQARQEPQWQNREAYCNCRTRWACRRSATTTVQPDNPSTRGKIAKIGYLLQVTEEQ